MKIAAVQMDVKILDKAGNLKKILRLLREAAQGGAQIVIFPECALTGYCFESIEEAFPDSESVPGPSTEAVAQVTKQLDSTAVIGLLERAGERVYNAAAVVDPSGVLGTYRKIHLPHLGIDRFVAPGDRPFSAFPTAHGRIGVNICYDCSFPEPGRVVKLQGAQLLAIPTNWPLGSDSWPHVPNVRATENHMIVAAADRVGEERGYRFAGHSQIVDFSGKCLAEAGEKEETILYADVNLAAADDNCVVRRPGVYEINRIADRRPEMYKPITDPVRITTKTQSH